MNTCPVELLQHITVCALAVRVHTCDESLKVFGASQQAGTNPWHLHSAASRVFSRSGMHGRIRGKQKQWLKRVTGSALISTSWENAREFSTIVRSLWEVISFPINYVRRAAAVVLSAVWATFSALVCLCRMIKTFQGDSVQDPAPSDVPALSFLWQRTMATSEVMALTLREEKRSKEGEK